MGMFLLFLCHGISNRSCWCRGTVSSWLGIFVAPCWCFCCFCWSWCHNGIFVFVDAALPWASFLLFYFSCQSLIVVFIFFLFCSGWLFPIARHVFVVFVAAAWLFLLPRHGFVDKRRHRLIIIVLFGGSCCMWHRHGNTRTYWVEASCGRNEVLFSSSPVYCCFGFCACTSAATQVDCCFVPFPGQRLNCCFCFPFFSCSGWLFPLATYQIVTIRPDPFQSLGTISESRAAVSKSICAGRFICWFSFFAALWLIFVFFFHFLAGTSPEQAVSGSVTEVGWLLFLFCALHW